MAPLATFLVSLTALWPGAVSDAGADEKAVRVAVGPGRIEISGEADSIRTEESGRHGLIVVDDGGDRVRVFADARVRTGEHLSGSVVAVFGSVEVEGEVQQDVVAVMGSVKLRRGAVVGGDVVSVGGNLEREEDVVVHGEHVSVGLLPSWWGVPALPVLLLAIAVCWITAVLVGWVLAALFPTRWLRVAATASRRTAASLLLGLATVPLVPITFVLLLVTVIGIPLALALPLLCPLLWMSGYLVGAYLLGGKLAGPSSAGTRLVWPTMVGTLLVAAFFAAGALLFTMTGAARVFGLFFCGLGLLLVCGLAAIGTGAFFLSRMGSEPRDLRWEGDDPLPAPPRAEPQPTGR